MNPNLSNLKIKSTNPQNLPYLAMDHLTKASIINFIVYSFVVVNISIITRLKVQEITVKVELSEECTHFISHEKLDLSKICSLRSIFLLIVCEQTGYPSDDLMVLKIAHRPHKHFLTCQWFPGQFYFFVSKIEWQLCSILRFLAIFKSGSDLKIE